jgi:hypothetical protein
MSLHKDNELKNAILALPLREKDKLLVRLINKDKMLMKQLHFQLLEDEDDLNDRITSLREKLSDMIQPNRSSIKNTAVFSNYKSLTVLIRQQSGLINEHEKVTKDKFSEVEFRLLILANAFKSYPVLFQKSHISAADKLQKYTIARLRSTIGKYEKLHEDLQFDLQESYNYVVEFAAEYDLY